MAAHKSSTAFRTPRTLQEIAANKFVKYDHELVDATGMVLHVRPKRINLPTAYDDLHFSSKWIMNWKRQRKEQYHTVNI